jgi:hypothetical protein
MARTAPLPNSGRPSALWGGSCTPTWPACRGTHRAGGYHQCVVRVRERSAPNAGADPVCTVVRVESSNRGWLVSVLVDSRGRRVSGQGGGAARIVLGLLYPRRLQRTYHAAGGGCRNWACQVRSWSFEGAGLDLDTGGRLDRLYIRVHRSVVGVSVDPSVVGRDWRPVCVLYQSPW